MYDNELGRVGTALRRTIGKIARRLAGLVLMIVAVGMSTCDVLDAVREPNIAEIGTGEVSYER